MQVHPLLKLAISHPHLVAEHAEAYAALAGEEMKKASSAWAVRIGLFAGAAFMLLIALIWGGIALMIAAAVPSDGSQSDWALWVVPLTPVVIAAGLALFARSRTIERPFAVLSKQLNDDMAVVREASGT